MSELSELMAGLSPEQRELFLLQLNKLYQKDVSQQEQIIPRRSDLGSFPMSFAQQRLWFIDQLDPGNPAYNISAAVRLTGPLDVDVLEQSINEVVGRHEALQAVFKSMDGKSVQVLAPNLTLTLPVVDLRESTKADQEAEARQRAAEAARYAFDLAQGPLLRASLLRLDVEEHIVLFTMHHIISDGWSMGVLVREIGAFYKALSSGRQPLLSELPIQYADFAAWQREWLQGDVLASKLSYWQSKLDGIPLSLEMPTDRPRPAIQIFQGALHEVVLPDDFVESLHTFCHRQEVTLFMVMLAALKVALFKWTGQADIVVGTVVANRNRAEIEPLVGCFMNFLPLRSQVSGNQTCQELLNQVKATVLEAYAQQDCPFDKIVEAIDVERRPNQNPIYNVAFLLQNIDTGENLCFSDALEATFESEADRQSSLLDLRFIAHERTRPGGLSLVCEYSTDLFEANTTVHLVDFYREILKKFVQHPETSLAQFALPQPLKEQAKAARVREQKQTIAIAATFTAEPIEKVLAFWMRELDIPSSIEFAPYNQVFQQLLDPASLLGENQSGVNVVLVRFEDWLRFIGKETGAGIPSRIHDKTAQNARDLVLALKSAVERSATPYLVCLCPAAPAIDASHEALFKRMEDYVISELDGVSGVYLVTISELANTYPVSMYYDPHGDKVGHIPFTPLYFAALGTMIARKIYAMWSAPYKVIVLDCDQTLWKGVCGEDGPLGIQIDGPWNGLQEFMVAQHNAGKLLCLCSKNNEEDVLQVFERRSEMPLRGEHIVSWRLNWQPKSENIRALAEELQLGLDSFIFLDDNPVECAEVQGNCPQVLTLQLPGEADSFSRFLRHLWAFDHLTLTSEDARRTDLYRQNIARQQFYHESLTFADFLANLELEVQISKLAPHQLSRAAQLTQRTNQFNCTTIRRSEAQVQELCQSGEAECLVVEASDRFGEYGLVGVVICQAGPETISVDTLLLSCRALGRGIEHRMIARLGEIAREQGLDWVEAPYIPSGKNRPALKFLEEVGADLKQPLGDTDGWLFKFPVERAAALTFNPATEQAASPDELATKRSVPSPAADRPVANVQEKSMRLRRIATELYGAEQVLAAIEASKRARPKVAAAFVPPRTPIEESLTDIWAQVLGIERVGIHDNFFDLGGNSLLMAQVRSKLQNSFEQDLLLIELFRYPTINALAKYLSQTQSKESSFEQQSFARAEVRRQAMGQQRQFRRQHQPASKR
jgi:FkbH-like protein